MDGMGLGYCFGGLNTKNIFPQMGGLNEIMEKSAESKNVIFESYLG